MYCLDGLHGDNTDDSTMEGRGEFVLQLLLCVCLIIGWQNEICVNHGNRMMTVMMTMMMMSMKWLEIV